MRYLLATILLVGMAGCCSTTLVPQVTLPEEPEILMRPPQQMKPIVIPAAKPADKPAETTPK